MIGPPRRRPLSLLAAAALLSAAAAGCATAAPPPLVAVPGEAARMRALLDETRRAADSRRGLRAFATLKVRSSERSGRFREVIAAERPARLRLETLNLLGQTQTLLVTDGERFAFFDGERIERGEVSAEILRRTLGLDLAPEEAVAALLAAPHLPDAPPSGVFGQGEDRIVELDARRLRFGPDGELRSFTALDPDGGVRWSAEYAGWAPADGGRYPARLVLDFPLASLRAELDVREVELNPELEAALFRVPGGPDR